MFDFIDGNKNGSISIVEFMTTMDDVGEADDYGKSHKSFFFKFITYFRGNQGNYEKFSIFGQK